MSILRQRFQPLQASQQILAHHTAGHKPRLESLTQHLIRRHKPFAASNLKVEAGLAGLDLPYACRHLYVCVGGVGSRRKQPAIPANPNKRSPSRTVLRLRAYIVDGAVPKASAKRTL
jgi:hypothetical protein